MLRIDRLLAAAMLGLAGLFSALTGCLERKETIRVSLAGAVDFQVDIKGDKSDFASGDALPDHKTGWNVEMQSEKDDQGNDGDKSEMKAVLRVHAGQPLPDSFAAPEDPLHDFALQFPTELKIEKKPDGTYYHFKRTYKARQFANLEFDRKRISDEYKLEELGKKGNEELTDEERAQMVKALIQIEGSKQIEFLRLAIDKLPERNVHWPQHIGLLARQALIDRYASVDLNEFTKLLGAEESQERDTKIAEMAGKFNDETHEILARRLHDLRLPQPEIEALMSNIKDEETRRAITEDLGDEMWEIHLQLPGEVVASNADSVENGDLKWEFKAESLMDRDVVLMATSRATRQSARPAGDQPNSQSPAEGE